jgi:hypothetical protein
VPQRPEMTSTAHGNNSEPSNQTGWLRWISGLHTLLRYEAGWLGNDLMAGLVLATTLVSGGTAYAVAT